MTSFPITARSILTGRHALVTGASKGIGRGIAACLAHAGCSVSITCRDTAHGQMVAEEIARATGSAVSSYTVDHYQAPQNETFLARFKAEHDCLDILVNNAGTGSVSAVAELTDEELRAKTGLNLSTPMVMCRGLQDYLQASGQGRILNISSVLGLIGRADRSVYCATKGGLSSFTRTLAVEFSASGCTVNALAPGQFYTPLTKNMWADTARREAVSKFIPMQRWGAVQELAGLVIILCTRHGGYITGQTLSIDGGWSVCQS